MARILFGLTFAAVAVSIHGFAFGAEHAKVLPADVKKAIEAEKAILIDVREVDEWKDGHIQDAKNLPLSELKAGVTPEKLKSLLPEGKTVYLHCAAGGRCLKAADLLKAAGYDVKPLKPGFEDLVKAGFPKAK